LASARIRRPRGFLSRGVNYGALRFDGVTGHRIFIVGGGNSAGQAAVFYSGYAAEVTMLVRGAGLTLSMSQYLIQQIREKANIHAESYTEVTSVHGENHLEQITTVTRPPDGPESTQEHSAKALCIMIGAAAKTDWLPPKIERDAKGYIWTSRDLTTWSMDRETLRPGNQYPRDLLRGRCSPRLCETRRQRRRRRQHFYCLHS
jgi:thioredoxin reductase (NADPH)